MKSLLFFAFFSTAFTGRQALVHQKGLRCILSADKKNYKAGELPNLTVTIYNDMESHITLIGALDGSDLKWRFPHCYFTINGPIANNKILERCGNMNTLRTEDFKIVKPGEGFNPYQHIDPYGFFADYKTNDKETFKKSGVYKIQFHYSTNTKDINEFVGDKPFGWSKSDSLQIDSLLKTVPRLELTSNEIMLKMND